MINRYDFRSVTWLDVAGPTSDDVRALIDECGLPTSFVEDVTSETPHTYTHAARGICKMVWNYPIVKRTDVNRSHQITCIATKKHFITIRYADIGAMHRYAKEFEMLGLLRNQRRIHGGHLLISFLTYMYEAMERKLEFLDERLADVERDIFSGSERDMVFTISRLSQRALAFRYTIESHEPLLEALPDELKQAFGGRAKLDVNLIATKHRHLSTKSKTLVHTVDKLEDTNSAMLTTKQNEIMKTLTIMAFVTFPLTLVSSLFSMNTIDTPIIGYTNDFWVIISAMCFLCIFCLLFFKFKRWM